MSTSCPRGLRTVPDGQQGPPVVPGASGSGRTYRAVDQVSRKTRAGAGGPVGWNNSPGHSGLYLRPRGVDQLSWVTRAWILGHALTTSCPGSLGPVSVGPQFPPVLPGELRSGPNICWVDQLSWVIRAWDCGARVRGPSGVDQMSRGTRATVPRAHGVDQLSRVSRCCVRGPLGSTSCPRQLGPGSEGRVRLTSSTR